MKKILIAAAALATLAIAPLASAQTVPCQHGPHAQFVPQVLPVPQPQFVPQSQWVPPRAYAPTYAPQYTPGRIDRGEAFRMGMGRMHLGREVRGASADGVIDPIEAARIRHAQWMQARRFQRAAWR